MITPALPIGFGEPPAASATLRITIQPSNIAPFAILDNGEAVAWAASEALAQRIADFLNWRAAMDSVECRYSEALQLDAHLHA